jgi:pyruvate kinase
VNFPGVKLPIPCLTKKDKKDLAFGIKHGVDFVSLSFVSKGEDVKECRNLIKELGGDQPLFAKIETQSAIEHIEEILELADGVMVARGDLGVEVPIEKVPVIQKSIIKKARRLGKPVIVATQMLTSMINSLMPTRADVSDIANAVLDGADALMLSDETTIGKYPLEAVNVMKKTIEEAEKIYPFLQKPQEPILQDEAIPHSCAILAKEVEADKIVVFTRSGISACRVSKFRPTVPILAVVHEEKVLRRLTIVWGVLPCAIVSEVENPEKMLKGFLKMALKEGLIDKEDVLVITMGSQIGKVGSTNMIRLVRREDLEEEFASVYATPDS